MGGLVTSASPAPSHRRSGHRIPSGGPCSSRFIAGLSPAFPADSLCFMHRLQEDCRVDMRPRHLSLIPLLIQEKPVGSCPSSIQFIILFSFSPDLGEERGWAGAWLWCGPIPKSAPATALGNIQRPWDPLVSPSILFLKIFIRISMCVLVTESCLTFCDPMDCSPPGFSVYGFFRQKYWSG